MADWIKIIVGASLMAWAIIPTPDDVTIVAPAVLGTGGFKLIMEGFSDK